MNQDSPPADSQPVTLINVFEVPAAHVEVFIAQWRERAALMSAKAGLLETRLHCALSPQARFQLVNVARWESREALQAALADAEFQERTSAVTADPNVQVSGNPALYQVAVEFSGPAAGAHRPSSPSNQHGPA